MKIEELTNDDSIIAAITPPSPPPSPPSTETYYPPFKLKYDVFLNFRGEDTRQPFILPLYDELIRNNIRTFLDDQGMDRGDEIASALFEAIENSSVFITVISQRYANSKWCLEELAKIVECRRLVLPVFYDVDPSAVRKQAEPFAEDFAKLEEKSNAEDVKKWRNAMAKVGGIAGFDSRNWEGEESRLIKKLVENVLRLMHNTPFGAAKYPVGIDSQVQEVKKMMDVELNGVRVLGLHGMGGIGKTTLAKAVYNRLVVDFKRNSFISNVRGTWKDGNGSISLQRKLIQDLSLNSVRPVVNVSEGVAEIKKLAALEEPVLIVLDDVDDAEHLNALASSRDWFYEGSILIITTRNKRVLHERIVNILYDVKKLDTSQSLRLFSYYAFGRDKPADDFIELSKQLSPLADGLPLALEVFGSFLYDTKNINDWHDTLHKLGKNQPVSLRDVLMISYDALDKTVQCIFLDIACFFADKNVKEEDAIDIFRGCDFNAVIAFTVLKRRSLLTITEDGTLNIHDQLRDMGREIVQRENEDTGMRSRLWDHQEVLSVLENKKGTRGVQGLVLNFEKKRDLTSAEICWFKFKAMPRWSTLVVYLKELYKAWSRPGQEADTGIKSLRTEAFEHMINLRLLQINRVKLDGKFQFIPHQLKWLQWKGCPLKYLPRDFCLEYVAILDLSESNLTELWSWFWWSWSKCKLAENLLVLDLHDCYYLTAIPDLSKQKKLEKLVLEKCVELTKIHNSVGDLSSLLHLNMKGCSSLVEFPSDVSGLKKLKELYLSGCKKLTKLPEDIGYMKSLKELHVEETAISKIPDTMSRLKELQIINLSNCRSLKEIPSCIGEMTSLRELKLDGSGVQKIHESIGSLRELEKLSLSGCTLLTALPDSIALLSKKSRLLLAI